MTAGGAGPLAGIRVIELVGIGPGPAAAMLLADLGADVIRIDRPGGSLTPAPPDLDFTGRGRPSVALDLKHPDAVEVVKRLVRDSDVLMEGFRPGVLERLGLGPDLLLAENPRLVIARITGWGQDGPRARRAGHDLNYIATTGVLDAIGREGGAPQIPLNLIGDFGGGSMLAVVGILAALLHVRGGGEGQVVDAAITDGVAHLSATILAMHQSGQWGPRGTNVLDSGAPFYDVYRTADDRWLSVAAIEPAFYAALVDGLGLSGLPSRDDRANWPIIRRRIASAVASRSLQHWTTVFADVDACVAPVLSFDDAFADEHNVAREVYADRDGLMQPRPAPRFSSTPTGVPSPQRRPGADTRETLGRLGIGIDDVDALIGSGAAAQLPS